MKRTDWLTWENLGRTAAIIFFIYVVVTYLPIARKAHGEGGAYYIETSIHVSGKLVKHFRYFYETYELCFMQAQVVKKHYGVDWLPECKPMSALTEENP